LTDVSRAGGRWDRSSLLRCGRRRRAARWLYALLRRCVASAALRSAPAR